MWKLSKEVKNWTICTPFFGICDGQCLIKFVSANLRDDAGCRDPDGEVTIRAAVGDAGGGQGEPRGDADRAAEDAEVEEHRRRRNICGQCRRGNRNFLSPVESDG